MCVCAKRTHTHKGQGLEQGLLIIGVSEPMQNDQEYLFSDIFIKFYKNIKIII